MYLVKVNQCCVCEMSPARRGVGGYCMVAHAASPLPGSYYWLLMMWGYDVIKILGSIGTIQYPTPRLAGDLSHYTTYTTQHTPEVHT